eukprot:TRINITY_DN2715_c0_g2_i2.p2 TRINITY_DN2715_c0_g2~~TRINITY_DN2715_c0_g2_i2.p2  ORF type:complete len:163 (-),score=38.63 TRINITY_DN2715_c0_g2_i2:11-499(-)
MWSDDGVFALCGVFIPRCVIQHLPVLQYLHTSMGVVPPRKMLNDAGSDLAALTFFHTEYGFTAEDVRELDQGPVESASYVCSVQQCDVEATENYFEDEDSDWEEREIKHTCDMNTRKDGRERLVYLRDVYGVTKENARRAVKKAVGEFGDRELITSVFGLEE